MLLLLVWKYGSVIDFFVFFERFFVKVNDYIYIYIFWCVFLFIKLIGKYLKFKRNYLLVYYY